MHIIKKSMYGFQKLSTRYKLAMQFQLSTDILKFCDMFWTGRVDVVSSSLFSVHEDIPVGGTTWIMFLSPICLG